MMQDDVTKLSNQLVPSPLSVCDLMLTALSLVEREWIRPELKHISSSGSESNEAQSRCERGREREVYSQFTAGNYWHCDINSSVIFSRPSDDDQKHHDPNKHTELANTTFLYHQSKRNWLIICNPADDEQSGQVRFYRTSWLQVQQPGQCSEAEHLIRFSLFHRFSFMFVLLMSFHLPLETHY